MTGAVYMKLLSPKIDVVFKSLFVNPDSADILSDFIASVLDIDVSEIKDIKILNTEISPEIIGHKYSRLDLLVKIGSRMINIEMQVCKLEYYVERALFYWAKAYVKDLKKGESYSELYQTISINILDYNMFDCNEAHSVFHLREDSRNDLLTDKCRFDFLELPKADTDKSPKIKRLKRWLRFFNLKSEEEANMLTQSNDTVMNKAVLILKNMSEDEKLQEVARIRERAMHDEASYMAQAKNEGIAIGEERGRTEGMNNLAEKLRLAGVDENIIKNAVSELTK